MLLIASDSTCNFAACERVQSLQSEAIARLDVAMAGSLSCADCIEALRRHADSFITVLDGDIMEQLLSYSVAHIASLETVGQVVACCLLRMVGRVQVLADLCERAGASAQGGQSLRQSSG